MTTALAAFSALDISVSIAGQFCARMLADNGAAVTLLEPAGGSAPRRTGPFDPTGQSYLFRHLNHGKSVVEMPVDGLRDHIFSRAAGTDVVVTDDHALAREIRAAYPRCVVSVVTDAGPDGTPLVPHGSELIYQALSGMMHNNGDYGRRPLYGVGHRASYAAGVVAYIGILAALFARKGHDQGQTVETEVVEVAASMCFPYLTQYIYNGSVRSRSDQRQPICPVLCRDGWICIWIYPYLFAQACRALGRPDLIDDPRFAKTLDRQRNWSDFIAVMAEHLADRGSEELVAHMQANHIIAAKTYRPTELLSAAHLRARGYWNAGTGDQAVLGPQFRMHGEGAAS